jgi:DNA polymerase-3 subunit gamma/tau
VVFVLATTDPQKVLPTIRSRTQHFEFRLIGPDVLVDLLKSVNKSADLGVPVEAIDMAVRRGRGSARDALSVLDQVAAAGVGEDEPNLSDEMVEALADHDVGRALAAVAEGVGSGRDPRRLAEDLLAHLRNGFLALMARSLVDLPDDAATRVEEQGRRLGPAGLTRALDIVGDALTDMREALDPRVSLEVALVRVARPETDGSPAALLERIERLERGQTGQAAAPAVSAARQALGALKTEAPAPEPAPAPPKGKTATPAKEAAPTAPSTGGAVPTRDALTAVWADEILPKLNQKARARFRSGRWVAGDGKAVFALPNDFHKDACGPFKAEVQDALSSYFGTKVPLELVVDEGQVAPVGGSAPAEEEHVDPSELADAPPGLASPEDRLKQAFPGAEEVTT